MLYLKIVADQVFKLWKVWQQCPNRATQDPQQRLSSQTEGAVEISALKFHISSPPGQVLQQQCLPAPVPGKTFSKDSFSF